jgi:hypothetical protein
MANKKGHTQTERAPSVMNLRDSPGDVSLIALATPAGLPRRCPPTECNLRKGTFQRLLAQGPFYLRVSPGDA